MIRMFLLWRKEKASSSSSECVLFFLDLTIYGTFVPFYLPFRSKRYQALDSRFSWHTNPTRWAPDPIINGRTPFRTVVGGSILWEIS